jgi:uncharacterized delta-60 repeat protein
VRLPLGEFTMNRISFLLASTVASVAVGAPHGELDGTFGTNGRVVLGWPFEETFGAAVVQQPLTGRLIVAGSTYVWETGRYDFLVVGLQPDGSPDPAFGQNGQALLDFGDGQQITTDVAVLNDGKILLAGWSGTTHVTASAIVNDHDLVLVRLNPDGSVDSTFGSGGRVTLDLGGANDYIADVAVLPDGKIVAAGGSNLDGDFDVVFARFDANGVLDTSFGGNPIAGATRVDLGGSEERTHSMVRQPDGKLIACGHSTRSSTDVVGTMFAVRLNEDGVIDETFGTEGVSLLTNDSLRESGRCLAMPGGKTLIAGTGGLTSNTDLLLALLNPAGGLDSSFGNAGVSTIDAGGLDSVRAVIRLADGSLAISGSTSPLASAAIDEYIRPTTMFLARVDATSGSLDADFGNGGITVLDFTTANYLLKSYGSGLVQQADGKLLTIGAVVSPGDWWDYNQIGVARVNTVGGGNAGVASFIDAYASVRESDGRVTLSVQRTGGTTGELSITYYTEALDAHAPGDFTATSGTLTWPSGDAMPKSIKVDVVNDSSLERPEVFHVVLTGPEGHVGFAKVLVGINDDDHTASQASGGGGGGAMDLRQLVALALILGMAWQRRRRLRFSRVRPRR